MNKPTQTPAGEQARILPRFRATANLEAEQTRILRHALGQAIADNRPIVLPATSRVAKAEPGDLRGIPAIGRGVGGAIPGTQPEQACIRRSERQAA